jgi:hypothetical protein
MKLQTLLIVTFTLGVTGCAEKEQAVPDEIDEAQASQPAAVATPRERKAWQNDAFMKHMHSHAEKLDELNFALADGDLDGAMTPAYWLSRHETVSDVPSELLPYLYRMREAARAVEEATDIATAQVAAESINEQCQGCHIAAEVTVE